jgi:hypothetical protein
MLPVEQQACKDSKIVFMLIEMCQGNGKLNFAAVTRATPDPRLNYTFLQNYVECTLNYVLLCPNYVHGTSLTDSHQAVIAWVRPVTLLGDGGVCRATFYAACTCCTIDDLHNAP